MGKRRRNAKLLYRFFISYTIVLLLPVLLIGLFVYQFFIQLLEQEVTKSNMNLLTQVRETIDVNMTELNDIAFHIAGNTNLTPYNVTKNPYAELNAMDQLRQYVSANQFIDQLLLYFHDHPALYTPYSTYDVRTYTEQIARYPSWEPTSFQHDLTTVTSPYVRGAEPVLGANGVTERMVTYVTPLPPNNPTPYGTVVFSLKESVFQNLLQKKFADDLGVSFILDEKGQLVASTTGMQGDDPRRLAEAGLQPSSAKAGSTVRWQERDYFAYVVRSEQFGWTIVSLVDQEAVLHHVERAKQQTLIGILLVLVLGGAVIFLATQWNYKPIRKLQRFAASKVGQELTGMGELESIQTALHYMSAHNEELSRNVSTSRPAVKHYVLLNLIRGKYANRDEVNRDMQLAGIQLARQSHLIAVLRFPKTNAASAPRLSRLDDLEHSFPDGSDVYGMESVDGTSLIFTLGTDEAEGTAYRELLLKAHRSLSDIWGAGITIGVGTPHGDPSELGKSYIEACGAIDYRLIEGTGKVIVFRDVVSASVPQRDYSKSDWNQFKVYMYQGDAAKIEERLQEIVQTIRERQYPLFMVKCICFDLINVMVAMMNEMNPDTSNAAEQYPDVLSLTEFETVEELIQLVNHISADLCGIASGRKESGNTALAEQMMAYMRSHYSSNQLSLQRVADEFQMSSSYLSRYFKDQTGQNVTQYIQTLRMDKAKELLREGADNLQDVVERIGYGSVSGFIRKFKACEGITPGEYRAMHQK